MCGSYHFACNSVQEVIQSKCLLFFFSEKVITVIMNFTCIMSTSFREWILFLHSLLHYNTLFPGLCEVLYACHTELSAEASELFTHVAFQLNICKMAFSDC
jgi:hypothetical protein